MKTIWKFTLSPESYIQVPKESSVLFVGNQHEVANIWFLVNTETEKEQRVFKVYGTGHKLPDNPGRHVGSFFMSGGSLVFHAFEEVII